MNGEEKDKKALLLVPAGTQIVTPVEAKVLNQNRFHARGSVGVVKSAPQDAQHAYLIEFADASLSSLKRKEFAIRKHFQIESAQNKGTKIIADWHLENFSATKE